MSSLDDRKLYRRNELGATDLVIASLWSVGGLLLRLAALIYGGAVVPLWWQ